MERDGDYWTTVVVVSVVAGIILAALDTTAAGRGLPVMAALIMGVSTVITSIVICATVTINRWLEMRKELRRQAFDQKMVERKYTDELFERQKKQLKGAE